MIISDVVDVERQNDFVYYRQEFSAVAVYSILDKERRCRFKFNIEDTATGERSIGVTLLDNIDYPILQVIIEIKQIIHLLIETNKLPLLN